MEKGSSVSLGAYLAVLDGLDDGKERQARRKSPRASFRVAKSPLEEEVLSMKLPYEGITPYELTKLWEDEWGVPHAGLIRFQATATGDDGDGPRWLGHRGDAIPAQPAVVRLDCRGRGAVLTALSVAFRQHGWQVEVARSGRGWEPETWRPGDLVQELRRRRAEELLALTREARVSAALDGEEAAALAPPAPRPPRRSSAFSRSLAVGAEGVPGRASAAAIGAPACRSGPTPVVASAALAAPTRGPAPTPASSERARAPAARAVAAAAPEVSAPGPAAGPRPPRGEQMSAAGRAAAGAAGDETAVRAPLGQQAVDEDQRRRLEEREARLAENRRRREELERRAAAAG